MLLNDLPTYSGGSLTSAKWNNLKDQGCVALPHSGITIANHITEHDDNGAVKNWGYTVGKYGVNQEGYYWASTTEFEDYVEPGESSNGYVTYDPGYAVYVTYLRSFRGGSYADDETFIYQDSGYTYWDRANMSTYRASACAVRLFRLLDKAPGY